MRCLTHFYVEKLAKFPNSSQWRIQGGGANPAMAPPPKLSIEFGPPRGQKE